MAENQIGTVDHFFGKISVSMVKLTDVLKVGDKIHFKGKSDVTQDVTSMQINRVAAQEGKPGDVVSIKVDQPVKIGDAVFKVVA
jgi:translation elongation factor EF-1alpha